MASLDRLFSLASHKRSVFVSGSKDNVLLWVEVTYWFSSVSTQLQCFGIANFCVDEGLFVGRTTNSILTDGTIPLLALRISLVRDNFLTGPAAVRIKLLILLLKILELLVIPLLLLLLLVSLLILSSTSR